MDSHGLMFNLIIYLSAAVIAVPIFTRLGLGSVLGYLVAGVCIGPWGLGFIDNVQDILHFSEFGVVLLLFIIGLELEPSKLWRMRKPILGAGGAQLGLSTAAIFIIGYLFGLDWKTAIIIGLGLSLSSTAIALQLFSERRLMSTEVGQTGFSILLFQDIAVIPIIALIPLLIVSGDPGVETSSGKSTWVIMAVIGAIFLVGRYVLRHVFRFVAATHLREIFTALSLLLVCGIAAIMNEIGVSMALGAFLAGVLLADSEYRHALESDIEPFKSLLLGLFFISVGMSVDFGLLLRQPFLILILTLTLVLVKTVVLYIISHFSAVAPKQRPLFSFLLSQSGEFAFVLFGFAVSANALDQQLANQMTLVVALSMSTTPLLMLLHDKMIEPGSIDLSVRSMDEINEDGSNIIIVGFGRFGQVVARLLMANKIPLTVIDNNPDHIERVRRFGYKAYYGDILRHDILHSAGADKAKLIILTGDGTESIDLAVASIKRDFPNLSIMVRAYDRSHAVHLIDSGVDGVVRETFYSAVELGKKTLHFLGFNEAQIDRQAKMYIEHDVSTLHKQLSIQNDEKAIISLAKNAQQQLEHTLAADQQENLTTSNDDTVLTEAATSAKDTT
ncbi:MAG: glutathione-regulated potassium-efflux system protein KefC [Gammaproteobacteria bacterium]|nr:glutathione-regulated potassium-efflux system protein KefC [Gammaproteobacteria bacterium]